MRGVTIHHLRCFAAVVAEGSFQAAALRLNRSHPSVMASVRNLEEQLGLHLFDRSGYRPVLTPVGQAFHDRSRPLLNELDGLGDFAALLASGEESELRIVIGDLCPQAEVVAFLRPFFDGCPSQLHFRFDALAGPVERLFDGEADLIVHHIDRADPRLESIRLGDVAVMAVAAPALLARHAGRPLTPDGLKAWPQCVIRDTARHSPQQQHFLVDGSPRVHVDDQSMKRELILQGMAWGHMPYHLVEPDLRAGRLVSLAGRALPGNTVAIVAARLRAGPHGPVAQRLWTSIGERVAASSSPLWVQGPA